MATSFRTKPNRATIQTEACTSKHVYKTLDLRTEKETPMKDIMGMMGKIKDMQAKMESMQEEIAAMECEGVSGGGMVSVKLSGKGQMLGSRLIRRCSRKTTSRSWKT
jgi:hypothetical protein